MSLNYVPIVSMIFFGLPTQFLFLDFVVAYGDCVGELPCMLHCHSNMVLADYFKENDIEVANPSTK